MSGRCLGVRMWPERAHDRAPMQVNMLDFGDGSGSAQSRHPTGETKNKCRHQS